MTSTIVHYIIFATDGRVRQSGHCDRDTLPKLAALFGDGYAVMEVPEAQYRLDIDATSYVLDGVITPKAVALDITEFTVQADGVEKVRFPMPAGTSVVHAGAIVAIEDNVFEFTTDVPDDHRFSFIAPAAFFNFEVTIHAV
ncbi:hypothetical protein GR212_17205 [Rhizobium lusitanum]|uniref:Uncharacterized protein n=1 Tax=Rhizobium lusitanum TaxID=293958 RepID=A0A6L9U9W9_9HYPH|nr:hypothetical protein [Rhizobium lusitanum]NEI71318.1 hypothetical protein [Rhizobium lusitanum]